LGLEFLPDQPTGLCAFRWGYQVDDDGTVTSRPPQLRDTATAWAEIRDKVQTLHPAWKLL
jgi:hypothetical protein